MVKVKEKQVQIERDSSKMNVFSGNTLREVINYANSHSLRGENIISILKENGQFWLIYYK